MAHNMTALQDVTTVYQLIDYANTQSSNALLGLFTVALFVVLLFVLKRYDFGNAMIASSFITSVVAILLAYTGLIPLYFPLVYIIITAGTAITITIRGS